MRLRRLCVLGCDSNKSNIFSHTRSEKGDRLLTLLTVLKKNNQKLLMRMLHNMEPLAQLDNKMPPFFLFLMNVFPLFFFFKFF